MKFYIVLKTYFPGKDHKHIFIEKEQSIYNYPRFTNKSVLTNINLNSFLYDVTIPEGQVYYEITPGTFACSYFMVSNPQPVTLEVIEQLIAEGADPTIDNYTPLINCISFNDFELFTYYHNIHGLPIDVEDNVCLKLALEKQETHQRFIEYIVNYTETLNKPKTNSTYYEDFDEIINETINLIDFINNKIDILKNKCIDENELECYVYDDILKVPYQSIDTYYKQKINTNKYSVPLFSKSTISRSISGIIDESMCIDDILSDSVIKKDTKRKKSKKLFGVFHRRNNKINIVNEL
jgi:hypothetical protein